MASTALPVALTFSANEYFAGRHPLAYGLTKLAALCGAAVWALARALQLPAGAAALAAHAKHPRSQRGLDR